MAITTMKTTGIKLTQEQNRAIANAINIYGDGAHPPANDKTIPHFGVAYVIECLTKYVTQDNQTQPRYSALVVLDEIKNRMRTLRDHQNAMHREAMRDA